MKIIPFSIAAATLGLVLMAAQGAQTDRALGLHSDGGGWGFRRAENPGANLPRVLLVGDSVMNSYRADVARLLAGRANVDTWATGMHLADEHLLSDLAKVLQQGPYEVIHFNIGLHDWPEGRIPAGQYEPFMERYVAAYCSNAPSAKLIWASSTPVTVKGAKTLDPRINPVILRQNEIAARVTRARRIPLDDLYTLGSQHLELVRGDQFHWTPEGARLLAGQVADNISSALGLKPAGSRADARGVAPAGTGGTSEFHVAPGGDDAGPGSAQKPFATLSKARDAVRASRARGENASVIVRGGVYRLEQTLEFNAADSGTAQSPVVWRAAPGETVRIVGGRAVPPAAIQPVTDPAILNRVISVGARQRLRQIDLSALGVKDCGAVGPRGFSRPYLPAPVELFIDGAPMPLSRWPKVDEPLIPIGKILDAGSITRNGEKPLRGGKFLVPTNRPVRWSRVNDIWISGLFHHGYADDTVCLAAIAEATNGLVFSTVQPHIYGFSSGKPWNAWYALNVLEEISQPGEYAVDRQAGKLYFLPPAGADLTRSEVMLSTLGEPLVALEGAAHVRFEGLVFEMSRGLGVYVEGGEACVLSGCVLRNLGMLGVCLGQGVKPDPLYRHAFTGEPANRQLGSLQQHMYDHPDFNRQGGQNHRIENCRLYNLGAGGVSLGGGDRKTLVPAGNTVFNCEIHDFNRWNRSYKAGVNIEGVGNRIQHCLIYNAPGTAIFLHGNDHLIENNEVHHVMQEGDDMGAFYMGRDPTEFGNVIRNNYFHDIGFGRTRSTWTIYYDDGACGSEAYGNLFVRAGRGGTFLIGGGKYNFTHDNVFVDCGLPIHIDNRQQGWNQGQIARGGLVEQRYNLMKADQPPFSVRYPQLAKFWQDNPAAPADPVERNLFVRCPKLTNAKPEWGPFKNNWETRGDPGFVDLARGDYRLKPDAEVFKQIPGFQPGDFSRMGLMKPAMGRSP